jgi:quercetin dioxygenase-like cupin family protein
VRRRKLLPFVQAIAGGSGEHGGMSIDIRQIPIHLGPGGTASPVEGFDWSAEQLAAYEQATRADGADGRMVMMFHMVGEWTTWERHPMGAEVVIACTGTHRFVQEVDGGEQVIELGPGHALVNPPGVWHTADSGEGGWIVTITPGLGTEHRAR